MPPEEFRRPGIRAPRATAPVARSAGTCLAEKKLKYVNKAECMKWPRNLSDKKTWEAFDHDYDAYYHVHPAVLVGAFQLIRFRVESLEGKVWVPARTPRTVMYHTGELHNQ